MNFYLIVACNSESLPTKIKTKTFPEIKEWLLKQAEVENNDEHQLVDVLQSYNKLDCTGCKRYNVKSSTCYACIRFNACIRFTDERTDWYE